MIEEQRPYRTFVIPLGLIQVIKDRHYYDPSDDRFDPARLLENMANPLHLTVGRGADDNGLISSLVNARLSRDLNVYRGFVPDREIKAEGLASPRFGHTFRTAGGNQPFHGVYIGAGPHLSVKTTLTVDEQLREIWSAASNTYLPNRRFEITNVSDGQAAMGITAGYRGRIALPGRRADARFSRNGIYLAGNYHYLRGFRYDAADMRVRFDTDSQGLLTLSPTTVPLTIDHPYSDSGQGFSLDLGIAAMVDQWEFGFGAEGLANRIEWDDMRRERFTLQSLINGGSFIEENLAPLSPKTRVELPVSYSGNAGYDNGSWAAMGELAHGFQGLSFHGGVEKRLAMIEVRGGTRYVLERWHPAGGVGVNITRRLAVDFAAFDTTANIERDRKLSFAVSLRLNRAPRGSR